jgi:Bacterial conjugation TrbI-like protein
MDIQDQSAIPDSEPSLQELAHIMELSFDENDPVSTQNHSEYSNDSELNYADAGEPENDDDLFPDQFDPEKNRTVVSLQNSGFAKAAVVVGGSFAVIAGGATLFQNQLPKNQVAQEVQAKPQDSALTTAQADAAKAQQSESETRAQLALAKQKDSLAQSGSTAASSTTTTSATSPRTASLTPVTAASSRPVIVSDSSDSRLRQRPAALPVVPTTSNPSPAKSARAAAKTVVPTAMPIATNRPSKTSVAAAGGMPSTTPIAKRNSNRQAATNPFHNQLANSATSNQRTAPSALPRSTQNAAASTLAASSATTAATNPFSTPVSRTAQPIENAQPATADRSLRDYLASNAATPGVDPAPANEGTPTSTQEVAIPGRGVVARNVPTTRRKSIRDKILQQMAWALPQNTSSPEPVAAPTLAEGVELAQSTQSLSEGIRLVQRETAATNTTPDQSLSNSANGARPSFYNSQTTGGKSADLKPEDLKAAGLAVNSSPTAADPTSNNGLLAKSILVGTSAKGSTVTPILWNAGTSSNAKFIIKLEEPIRDNTNQPAIPAGTQLVVTVKPAAANIGFAELEVISVIIQGREFTPPVGMLAVRDENNGLLVGEDYFRRNDQIASRDSMTVFTGALSRVGQVLNQPTSTIATTGIGSTTVVNNQSPNILGAILEGGFSSLPATWSQRNQQALQEIANKPNVYQIPQGRTVRIFVNQSLEF